MINSMKMGKEELVLGKIDEKNQRFPSKILKYCHLFPTLLNIILSITGQIFLSNIWFIANLRIDILY